MKFYKILTTAVSAVLAFALLTGCGQKEDTSKEAAPDEEVAVVEKGDVETVMIEDTANMMIEKLNMSASTNMEITATVSAIDLETRLITLTGSEGNSVEFVVSEEARNLAQVSVGDKVIAEYMQQIDVSVVAPENLTSEAGKVSAAVRSEEGDMPGAAILESEKLIFFIEDINMEENSFKLKDAEGVVTEYIARNPENLKKAAVGDAVIARVTAMVAISVEKAPME